MKWFLDLVVHGKPDAVRNLLEMIESDLPPGWSRDRDNERLFAECVQQPFCIIRRPNKGNDIGFVLVEREPGILVVEHVVAYSCRCLTSPEHSAYLYDFFSRSIKPGADQLNLKYFSSGFEDRCPEWAKDRRQCRIEKALGFAVVRQLRAEGYTSPLALSRQAKFNSSIVAYGEFIGAVLTLKCR